MSAQPTQPEALRLADLIHCGEDKCQCSFNLAAAELRRLHALAAQGTPTPAGEPVAYLIDWPDEPELGHYFAEAPTQSGRSQPLYTAPPVRAPLSEERVKGIAAEAGYDIFDAPDPERAAFINGLRHGEQAHGITGAAA